MPVGSRHYEVPVRFTWNLSGGQAGTVKSLLSVLVAGYELKEYEIAQAERLILLAENFLGATYGQIGTVRTGYRPKEARVGADDAYGHCVCCQHKQDD